MEMTDAIEFVKEYKLCFAVAALIVIAIIVMKIIG